MDSPDADEASNTLEWRAVRVDESGSRAVLTGRGGQQSRRDEKWSRLGLYWLLYVTPTIRQHPLLLAHLLCRPFVEAGTRTPLEDEALSSLVSLGHAWHRRFVEE